MFSVETGLMQQCRDIHAAGIESSNAARFKLISRISCGLQHNVMLLGRRSDLWRRPFSRCHQRTQQLQKKKKKKRQRQTKRAGNTERLTNWSQVPKSKKLNFDIFRTIQLQICITVRFCHSYYSQKQFSLVSFIIIKHPLLSSWPMTTVSVTGLNLNHVFGLRDLKV